MSDEALFIRCDCHNPEHMLIFDLWHWDRAEPLHSELIVSYGLDSYIPWWKRAALAFKYVVTGKTTRHWWAETVITDDDAVRLRDYLNGYLSKTLNGDRQSP